MSFCLNKYKDIANFKIKSCGSNIAEGLNSLFYLAIGGLVAIVLLIVFGLYSFFKSDEVKSDKFLTPTIVIKTVEVDGVKKSDTTYIYKK